MGSVSGHKDLLKLIFNLYVGNIMHFQYYKVALLKFYTPVDDIHFQRAWKKQSAMKLLQIK